mgnify:CR=1 FL=1
MKTTFLDFEQPIAELEGKIEELRFVQDDSAVDISEEISRLETKSQSLTKDLYAKLSPWQIAQVARHPQRPYTLDYASLMFTDFHELHGDRNYADDKAIVGGLARFNGQACVLAIIRDITEREQQSRAFLRAQRIGQVGTWIYDTQRRAFEASAEACRIVGAPSSTLRMEDLVRKIHPADAQKVRDDWNRMLAGGAHDLEYRLIVDGEIRWTHVRAEAERDQAGRIVRVAALAAAPIGVDFDCCPPVFE